MMLALNDRVFVFLGEVVHEISTAQSLQFDFGTIRAATDNFSDSKKLGQGGFGAVYRVIVNKAHPLLSCIRNLSNQVVKDDINL